jgi:hypothetical protein
VEFTLVYRGPLKSNGNATEKQTIRRAFHGQLKILWTQPPLSDLGPPTGHLLDDNPPQGKLSVIQRIGAFRLAPVVSTKLHLIAELDITFLRPEPPGSLITQGGDIDNRLKTLFDALRIPHNMGEIPGTPLPDEDPFFCLLEDDNLITKVGVATDRLLEPTASKNDVQLFIQVKTKVTRVIYGNIGLA